MLLLSPYLRVTSWTMPIFVDRPWKTETTSFKRGSHESDLDLHLDSARANVVSKCWSLSQVGLLLCCCEPNVTPQDADRRRTGVRCCHAATVPLCGTAAPLFSQPYLNIFQVLGNTGTPPVPIYLRVVKICQIWDERRLSAVMLTRVGFWFTAISELCYHTCRPLKNWLVGVPDCHNHHCSTYAWRIQR